MFVNENGHLDYLNTFLIFQFGFHKNKLAIFFILYVLSVCINFDHLIWILWLRESSDSMARPVSSVFEPVDTQMSRASKTLDYSVDSPFFLAAASILLLVAILVLNGEYSTSVKFFNIKTLLW